MQQDRGLATVIAFVTPPYTSFIMGLLLLHTLSRLAAHINTSVFLWFLALPSLHPLFSFMLNEQSSGIEHYRWRSRSFDYQGQKLELHVQVSTFIFLTKVHLIHTFHFPSFLSQHFASYTCHVSGPGLQSATANHSTHVIVELTDSGNRSRSLRQNVTAELEPIFKAPPTSPFRTVNAAVYAVSPSKYEISYTPPSRGQHKLCVRINGIEIDRSPFSITVYPNPTQLGYTLNVMKNVITPHNIAVNSCGKFVISERADHQIAIFDPNGRRVRTFGTNSTNPDGMKRPRGIAIDDTDNIYVSSENKLQKFTSRGELIKCVGEKGGKEGEFNQPHGMVLFNQELYVCDSINDRIQVFNMDLKYIRSIGSFGKEIGKFSIPRDIKFDRDGNMYIAEWGNARVQVLDNRGHFIRVFGEEDKLGRPSALHIVDEYVYVSDLRSDCIVVYETSGKFVTSFGKCGDGEGEFASPRSITSCADGYIYVCDQDNNRVQVF